MKRIHSTVAFLMLISSANLYAANETLTINKSKPAAEKYHLLAQYEGDDSYDPFADYSEFEENQELEADINFFRNGRFFTLGVIAGYRGFTENLKNLYSGGATYGLFLSYFFDLRFALQLSFLTGDHTLSFTGPVSGKKVTGTIGYTSMSIYLKYYFNTQNVTKGLADLNPYLVGGFSQVYRTSTVDGQDAFGKDSATGFDLGFGMEFPMMRNKMYLGWQATYQLVTFKGENTEIRLAGNEPTGIYPTGDSYYLVGILGMNF